MTTPFSYTRAAATTLRGELAFLEFDTESGKVSEEAAGLLDSPYYQWYRSYAFPPISPAWPPIASFLKQRDQAKAEMWSMCFAADMTHFYFLAHFPDPGSSMVHKRRHLEVQPTCPPESEITAHRLLKSVLMDPAPHHEYHSTAGLMQKNARTDDD